MKVCIEGCAHGDLDVIYHKIYLYEQQTKEKVDLLICCGDFQATRNLKDLACMAVPPKYLDMCSFYKYYTGEMQAPILTIFIGGNHEASNHLQELAYGGWVAKNIFYLGYAGVINVNGIRIGGLSGIYRDYHYDRGHFELVPYDENAKRSVYAIRSLEVFKLKQLTPGSIDIMLSHDWPQRIWEYGNRNARFGSVEGLLRLKPAFKEDMDSGKLGSKPCMELLKTLKPKYWFSAHMHCRFDAVVKHEDENSTVFVALDKCLPKRQCFEFLDIGDEVARDDEGNAVMDLQYDKEWLAILSLTNKFLNCEYKNTKLPVKPVANDNSVDPGQRWNFTPTDEEKENASKRFNENLKIPDNFRQTEGGFSPEWESMNQRNLRQPDRPSRNIQTVEFCDKLGIDDPLLIAAILRKIDLPVPQYSTNVDYAFEEKKQTAPRKMVLPKPVNDEEIDLDDLDDNEEEKIASNESPAVSDADTVTMEQAEDSQISQKHPRHFDSQSETDSVKEKVVTKKFKRRNQNIYGIDEDV